VYNNIAAREQDLILHSSSQPEQQVIQPLSNGNCVVLFGLVLIIIASSPEAFAVE
jgi:hypothetical protein